ncbi:serpin-Z4-like [Camellia sinensis]|uniref:serpin-Z4-like n=1 Tax=Camellia sinensis TaxID=4442 RepID=UPI001035CDF3|nr:serpin-Z4-like [Camellia sinensis]
MEDMGVSLNVKSETVISNICHKACVEIDKVGTEAVAITVSTSRGCSLYEPKKVNFFADHPFLFMIKEEVSGLVIFTGAVFNLQDLGSNLDLVKLDEIWIPKFKFSYDFDVCDAIHDVGHSLPFSENPTDFTEMIHVPKGIPFFVSNMFHKAFIEVDKKGTEATIFSMCSMFSGCAMRQIEHSSFIANHPSVFIIKEEMSGLVFFTGTVVNPI